jgi:hypothetical protein
MKNHRRTLLLIFATLVIAAVAMMTTLRGQDQGRTQTRDQQRAEFESQFPIADYSASEPADPQKRAQRRARGNKYNNSPMTVTPSDTDGVTSSAEHWAEGIAALPVEQSNTVVVGEVTDAQAFMSVDKTGVYSEFVVRIGEVLKNDPALPLTAGTSITVERPGGRVKFPSGNIGQYFTVGQGMPRVGKRYMLFLTQKDQDYQILTGYELRAGRILLLDNPGAGHPLTAYKDTNETSLLNDVRAAVNASSQPKQK